MVDFILSAWDSLALSQLGNFHFLRPWWLLAAVPLFVFYRLLHLSGDLFSQWRGVMNENIISSLAQTQQKSRWFNPKKLFAVFCVIATLVMAGPSWKQQATPFFVDESVLVIALDVSESMQTSDLQPSRILRAKQKINELLEARGDAKTALIVYAGSAHVAMPITRDRKMIAHFLDVLDTDLMPEKTKNQQSIIKPVAKLLAQTNSPSTLLLVTDKTDSDNVGKFKEFFNEQQHQMVVWAIAENPDSGLASSTGLSEMQLQQLDSLADAGHGNLVTFTHSSDDVQNVKRSINNNMFLGNDKSQPWYDAGYLLLFILLILQAQWFRRGWTMQW
ncbi:VWA domain-containing protein [Thalassomonas sp. M1454]|uniref:VWA domain-containing protein n=1 Tax=Thalassomonas sp. M1454 TaxID=2594477 RepID=UPI00117E519C|nr:VWA domain-containing protein [Thalassomonas sp. M1454]TRX54938.1 VWA domain-containing protein [Thalassomonas sp. M1454]